AALACGEQVLPVLGNHLAAIASCGQSACPLRGGCGGGGHESLLGSGVGRAVAVSALDESFEPRPEGLERDSLVLGLDQELGNACGVEGTSELGVIQHVRLAELRHE